MRESLEPDKSVDPADNQIIYIGETSVSLHTRWTAFDLASRGRKGSHSGGRSFFKQKLGSRDRNLCVAASPFSPLFWRDWIQDREKFTVVTSVLGSEQTQELKNYIEFDAGVPEKGPHNTAWIKYVERTLLLDYVLKWDRFPICNGL